MTPAEFEKWCDERACVVCAKWFPLEKQLPATALFDIVKVALIEAAQMAPRDRVLDEAEIEKANPYQDVPGVHSERRCFARGARWAMKWIGLK